MNGVFRDGARITWDAAKNNADHAQYNRRSAPSKLSTQIPQPMSVSLVRGNRFKRKTPPGGAGFSLGEAGKDQPSLQTVDAGKPSSA